MNLNNEQIYRVVEASERLPEREDLVHIFYMSANVTFKTTGFFCLKDLKWKTNDCSTLLFQNRVSWLEPLVAAEECDLYNTPCLSFNDLVPSLSPFLYTDDVIRCRLFLIDLVKSKLNHKI